MHLLYVYMCVYMYICIYVYMYICIYVYMYICIYVYVKTFVCVNTNVVCLLFSCSPNINIVLVDRLPQFYCDFGSKPVYNTL